MQRKELVLKSKRGFGIQSAIFIMLLLSSIAIFALYTVASRIEMKSRDFELTQAKLLAKSGVEYAILAVNGFDRSGGECLEYIDIDAQKYDVNITLWYVFASGEKPEKCTHATQKDILQSQNGTAIIDVAVKSKASTNEPVAVHKRAIELP